MLPTACKRPSLIFHDVNDARVCLGPSAVDNTRVSSLTINRTLCSSLHFLYVMLTLMILSTYRSGHIILHRRMFILCVCHSMLIN